jgi:hypothetical protein
MKIRLLLYSDRRYTNIKRKNECLYEPVADIPIFLLGKVKVNIVSVLNQLDTMP